MLQVNPTTPSDVSRPMEALKAKATGKDKANLAMDTLWKNVLEEEYAF